MKHVFSLCVFSIHAKCFSHRPDRRFISPATLHFSFQIIIIIIIIQSTLVISKSKGPSKTVRDIRTSTYQICSIEEKTI